MIQNYGDEMLKIKNNRLYITQGQLMNATVSDGEKKHIHIKCSWFGGLI